MRTARRDGERSRHATESPRSTHRRFLERPRRLVTPRWVLASAGRWSGAVRYFTSGVHGPCGSKRKGNWLSRKWEAKLSRAEVGVARSRAEERSPALLFGTAVADTSPHPKPRTIVQTPGYSHDRFRVSLQLTLVTRFVDTERHTACGQRPLRCLHHRRRHRRTHHRVLARDSREVGRRPRRQDEARQRRNPFTTAHLSWVIDDRFHRVVSIRGEEAAALAAESHRSAIDLIETIVRAKASTATSKHSTAFCSQGMKGGDDPKKKWLR